MESELSSARERESGREEKNRSVKVGWGKIYLHIMSGSGKQIFLIIFLVVLIHL